MQRRFSAPMRRHRLDLVKQLQALEPVSACQDGRLSADGAARRDRVQRVVCGLVRADGAARSSSRTPREAETAQPEKETAMFDSLARRRTPPPPDRPPSTRVLHARQRDGGSVATVWIPTAPTIPPPRASRPPDALEKAGFRDAAGHRAGQQCAGRRARDPAQDRDDRRRAAAPADVASVTGYYDARARALVSTDGNTPPRRRPEADRRQAVAGGGQRHQGAARQPAEVVVGGPAVAHEQVNEQVETDLRRAELLALPLLFLLSFVFFRSVVAALLPLMVGVLTIVGTFLSCASPASSARSRSSPST